MKNAIQLEFDTGELRQIRINPIDSKKEVIRKLNHIIYILKKGNSGQLVKITFEEWNE